MARTLFFRMVRRKFLEISNKKSIFRQYNNFYKYKYFFFSICVLISFQLLPRKGQSNQEQCSLCCSSTCFRKLKEIGVLRHIFPDYVISCDYDITELFYISRKVYSEL